MSVAEAFAVDALRLELQSLVDVLTVPGSARLDDGRRAPTLALLDAVEDARTARTRLGGASQASTSSPVRLGALELLADVDRVTGAHGRGRPRRGRVRAWAAAVASTGSADDLLEAVEWARWWDAAMRGLIEPSRWLPLRGALCPTCGARDVVTEASGGERVVNPALIADLRAGSIACQADRCGALWAADQLYLLADQLDRQAMTEVLAVE